MIGIVGINEGNYIGKDNSIPWHYKEDMQFFKKTTTGGTVVMGRKTWDSLPKKPLPNRNNLVLTGGNFPEALAQAQAYEQAGKNVFIIGGMKAWELFMPYITTFYISRIKENSIGDLKFFEPSEFKFKHIIGLDNKLSDNVTVETWIPWEV